MTDDTPNVPLADVHDVLAQHYDDYEVRDLLHDVPPHVVHEVTVDGRRAVCKVGRGPTADAAVEGRVTAHAAAHTPLPVPAVLAVGDGGFVAAWEDRAPDEPEPLDGWARVAGRTVARLHAETAGDFETYGVPRAGDDGLGLDAHETWAGVVRDRLRAHREYLAGVGHADVAEAVVAFLEAHPDAFAGAGDPVLCHGNVLPDHLATEGDRAACLIDFEHALVAPGEYDVWRTALPAFLSPDEERDETRAHLRAFREGYESVRLLPPGFDRRCELYEVVLSVSYLQALYVQRNAGPDERERQAAWLREYVFDTLDSLEGSAGATPAEPER